MFSVSLTNEYTLCMGTRVVSAMDMENQDLGDTATTEAGHLLVLDLRMWEARSQARTRITR